MGSVHDLRRITRRAELSLTDQRRGWTLVLWGALLEKDDFMAKLSIHQGADLNARTGYLGRTPLTYSILHCDQLVHLLLNHGANPNHCDRWGDYPLHLAAACGKYGVLRRLIRMGADVKARSSKGKTALDVVRGIDGLRKHKRLLERILFKAGAA